MDKSEFELIVSPGRLPIYKIIISAAFFSVFFYFTYNLGVFYYASGLTEQVQNNLPNDVYRVLLCFAGGVHYATQKTVLIDVDKDKLISRYFIGPISVDRASVVPHLEYVSVFRDQRDEYQVNLWYKGNKHYKMYAFEEKAHAMKFGAHAAETLKTDLLDATVKGDSKWIDRPYPV